jgi:hypothetical protein
VTIHEFSPLSVAIQRVSRALSHQADSNVRTAMGTPLPQPVALIGLTASIKLPQVASILYAVLAVLAVVAAS